MEEKVLISMGFDDLSYTTTALLIALSTMKEYSNIFGGRLVYNTVRILEGLSKLESEYIDANFQD